MTGKFSKLKNQIRKGETQYVCESWERVAYDDFQLSDWLNYDSTYFINQIN